MISHFAKSVKFRTGLEGNRILTMNHNHDMMYRNWPTNQHTISNGLFVAPKSILIFPMRFFHMGLVSQLGLPRCVGFVGLTLTSVGKAAFLLPKKGRRTMLNQAVISEVDGLSPSIVGNFVQVFINAEVGFRSYPILKLFEVAIYGEPNNPQVLVGFEDICPNDLADMAAIQLLAATFMAGQPSAHCCPKCQQATKVQAMINGVQHRKCPACGHTFRAQLVVLPDKPKITENIAHLVPGYNGL
jgi:Zn ribbon nucleic-acid-binding protein